MLRAQILDCRSLGRLHFISWVFSMVLASYHLLVPRFLENLRTLYIGDWGFPVSTYCPISPPSSRAFVSSEYYNHQNWCYQILQMAAGGKCKGRYTLSVKLSDFTVWCHTWRKNWVNCAVMIGNSAGLRTVLSSRLSHRELRSSLRESHIFLSLPADTTMTPSQGTQPSKMNKIHSAEDIAWYIPFQIPLLIPHFTFSFLLFG